MTRVVNLKVEAYDVYIGRAGHGQDGFFGNPFRLGAHESRGATLDRYKRYLWDNPDVLERLPELRGKTLGCFCKPQACHGDVIVACLEALTDEQIIARANQLKARRS